MNDENVKTAVDIALLQQGQAHIQAQMNAFHSETKKSLVELSEKFDAVLDGMSEEKARRRLRSNVWAATRHIATIVVTLFLAKKFNIPVDPAG